MNNKNILINKKAFTLSEVLITLTVIGVVAALAIPALLNTTNEAEYKTALKKQYAEATQVLKRIAYDRGGSLAGFTSIVGLDKQITDDFKDMVLPYVNSVKNCGTAEGNSGIVQGCKLDRAEVFNYDGTPYEDVMAWGEPYAATIVLSNGAIWYFHNYGEEEKTCSETRISSGPYKNKSCGILTIDTNGLKKPNRTNKDIFKFHIAYDGTLVPWGSQFDIYKDTYSLGLEFNPRLVDMLTK